MRQLEAGLGVRLLNRSSRRFGTTEAGREFYRHAAAMVRQAEVAETAIRLRSSEPTGLVRFTASLATMQFGIRHMLAAFLERHPKVDLFAHATDRYVDVVGDNYDVAIRAHADPLPDSGLIQRVLAPAPWFLFAGAAYLDRHGVPATPDDLAGRPSLFMVRKGVAPRWRLRHAAGIRPDASVPLSPRVASDDMVSLKQAAIDGCGIVALPGYVCRDTVVAGDLRRILPDWIAGESTLTALLPYREGLLPSVRAFVDHLAAEFPKVAQV